MVRGIVTKGAFYWLRTPKSRSDVRADEWILAIIRLLLGLCFLTALFRPESTYNIRLYAVVAIGFVCYGILAAAALSFLQVLPLHLQIYVHCLDLFWATLLACLVFWPTMTLAVTLFVIIITVFRWGFWEAILTAAAFSSLLMAGYGMFQPARVIAWQSVSRKELLAEGMFYSGMVCMIGLLAQAKATRTESLAMSRMISDIRIQSGLEHALRSLARQGIRMYGATQFLVVIHEKAGNRLRLFRTISSHAAVPSTVLDASQHPEYFFPEPGMSMRVSFGHSARRKMIRCFECADWRMRTVSGDCSLPDAFRTNHPFKRLLATAFEVDKELVARVYVLDPCRFFSGAAGVRYLSHCMQNLSPAIRNLFAVGKLTKKARGAASGQVARELHDGIIQSLSAINLQIEDLRQKSNHVFGQENDPLERIQCSIRKEIVSLRDFIQQLRSLELDSGNLLSFLAGMAVKFQTEHGIATRFVSDVDQVPLPPYVCGELARITQEALINVRKHSNAKEALVRLNRRNGSLVLSILDNGRGFGFSGRRSHEELQESGEGPIILMDRAKSIGGKVSIESYENSGACVEVAVPAE